ncbi:radical S-adenosyl methionine domain-containing protein 1 [Podochytrium sp. JEL0797]|nr:radical S-adenosyl methionine domain-containing protein 1 [Podochytrium sp. JEL0797]
MPPSTVKSLTSLIKYSLPTSPTLQIALEGNPSSLPASSLHQFKTAGINRLSIGIQSFCDTHLSLLGRDHSSQSAWDTLNAAYHIFNDPNDTVSCDLMFGIPGQSPQEWKHDLNRVVETIPSRHLRHMSLYQLTFEPGTPLHKQAVKQGLQIDSTPDSTAEMYETGVNLLHSKTALRHYEVSNFAQPGHESVHNLAYWRGWDFIGVGPGAHGRISDWEGKTRIRTSKFRRLETYIEACETVGHGTQTEKRVDLEELMKELIVVGLRIKEGVSFRNARDLAFGNDVKQLMDWDCVKRYCEMGMLEYDDASDVLRPTERGLAVIDAILVDIFSDSPPNTI